MRNVALYIIVASFVLLAVVDLVGGAWRTGVAALMLGVVNLLLL